MVKINIETLGDERFLRSFSRISRLASDYREPLAFVAEAFYRINENNFDKEGVPENFVPLSPKYKRWKDRHYPGKKIMQLTGRLMNSLTAENQADSQDTVRIIAKDYAELGTLVPYAHRHQKGTFGMPRRKVVQVTDKHKVEWGRIVHRWAFSLFTKEGFKTSGGEGGPSV